MWDGKTYLEMKPVYKKMAVIVLAVIVLIAVIESQNAESKNNNEATIQAQNSEKTETEIVYEKVSAEEMLDLLEKNALKAEKTYQDKHLEIIGQINVIDSDGKYISIEPVGATFTLAGIQLYIKNKEQINVIMELSKGSKVVIKGKVKKIGEVIGYMIDLDEIAPASEK